ncbi:transcriptional regulator [Streptococcus pneumoniae]|uniref:transcriptional regulator n=1 Tax=Streptococcus pneumoniae TaxID=1313 RepID=UPI00099F0DCC|nr:transcriptional regulator [Streptococcus pneumoniae]
MKVSFSLFSTNLTGQDLTKGEVELTRKMFAGEFHYPSELNRLYQKIRHYKMEQRMPQSPWVERIVQILDLDYEDLFRR